MNFGNYAKKSQSIFKNNMKNNPSMSLNIARISENYSQCFCPLALIICRLVVLLYLVNQALLADAGKSPTTWNQHKMSYVFLLLCPTAVRLPAEFHNQGNLEQKYLNSVLVIGQRKKSIEQTVVSIGVSALSRHTNLLKRYVGPPILHIIYDDRLLHLTYHYDNG